MSLFEDEDEMQDPAETLTTDEESDPWDWQVQQEQEMRLAGIIAKAAEKAGLIQPTDQFSWEWHAEFDAEIEAAERKSVEATPCADSANTGPVSGNRSGPESGSDFGGNFGSDFGVF